MICCFSGKATAMLVSRKEEACFRIQERAKIQAIRPHIIWSPEKISDDLFR
jgi:cellobiose-specific phosphotransferase system component IIB